MRRITFTADDELAEELVREAKSRRRSLSEVIRERLRAGGEPQLPRRFSFIGMGNGDGTWTAAQLDEYLAENWSRDILRHRDR